MRQDGGQVHAYVLLPNHFHLVIETPRPNLVAGMKWLLGTYTNRFNRRHKLGGHLFCGRYKSLIIDGSGSGYLKTVCDYVHLNPGRAKLVQSDGPLKRFPWSSWPAYLLAPSKRPVWRRRRLEQALEGRRGAEAGGEFKAIRRGWFLGDERFRKELLAQMGERMGPEHYGEERAQREAAKAERILAEELKRRRWKPADLSAGTKGAPEKVARAARLRAETTMTVGWIAERLGMGTRGYLNHLLYLRRKSRK